MLDSILHFFSSFWHILRETSPFLLLGLILAGILHVIVPSRLVYWALGRGGWEGAIRGALLGIPLPLCSCSVVPTALTLRRQGASMASVAAFTISTPETSLDALALTAALLPAAFLGVRPLVSILLAICVGIVVEWGAKSTQENLRQNLSRFSRLNEHAGEHDYDVCRVCGLLDTHKHNHGFVSVTRAILEYAFFGFFQDIAHWIFLGFALAAAAQVFLPDSLFHASWFVSHSGLQIGVTILAGIPLYSCATATTPFVAALIAKGLNPGAGLALLITGPATNLGNIFAFKKEFGVKITVWYYSALFSLCWIFGMLFNSIWPVLVHRFPSAGLTLSSVSATRWFQLHLPGWVEIISSWVILFLTFQIWMKHRTHGGHNHSDHIH